MPARLWIRETRGQLREQRLETGLGEEEDALRVAVGRAHLDFGLGQEEQRHTDATQQH